MSDWLIVAAMILLAVSGVPGLFLPRTSAVGQRLQALLAVLGGLLGLAGVVETSVSGDLHVLTFPWSVPGGEFAIAVDGLSAVFLVPIFLIAMLGSMYGLGYWKQAEHPENGRQLRLFYGLMAGGMALLVVARNAVVFLMGWEIMALSAYFLVTTEERSPSVRRAGWVYLVATHTATLCLFAVFGLLYALSGTFAFVALPAEVALTGTATLLWLLALTGFGLKAGLMPLHVWLPSAHAMAPSHVSALMSGVLIKMGVYGLVRVSSFFPDPPTWWGGVLLGLGLLSGVLGIAFAIGQGDLKRLLAYSSIENMGIIAIGLGLALLGRSLREPAWVVLGLGGALLHVLNHSLFKSLLFFSAGSIIHATHTRRLDQLGGLAKSMPRTAVCFLAGALAVCALPPLNGFVSELLLYMGLFKTFEGADTSTWADTASLAAPGLAFIGALALACFVKAYAAAFLGSGRSEHAEHAHEAGPAMLGPMYVLAGCCLAIGLAPGVLAGFLDRAIRTWAPKMAGTLDALSKLVPLDWISLAGGLLLGLVLAGGVVLAWRLRRGGVAAAPTWDCGYAAPTPRMQYTAASFAQMLVGLFEWALRPRTHVPHQLGLFPKSAHFRREIHDTVLCEAVLPAFTYGAWFLASLRWLQRGGIHRYLLYIFLVVLALLVWS